MRGTTNAIKPVRKVLASFTGKYYRKSSYEWYWCMDADQIEPFRGFMSDMEDMITCFAFLSTKGTLQSKITGWNYELTVGSAVSSTSSPPTEPSLTGTIVFRGRAPSSGTGLKSAIEIVWNKASSSAVPTQVSNTYSISNYSGETHTSGEVGYLSLLKMV